MADKKDEVQMLCKTLPSVNVTILDTLCDFLRELDQHSDVTKMNASNLALVFAPGKSDVITVVGLKAAPRIVDTFPHTLVALTITIFNRNLPSSSRYVARRYVEEFRHRAHLCAYSAELNKIELTTFLLSLFFPKNNVCEVLVLY